MDPNRTIVCVSGGQDSTTCLTWALSHFAHVEALTFDYGQRHDKEKEAVEKVCRHAGVLLKTLPIPALLEIGGGGLTSETISVMESHPQFEQLPGSFVPLRNLILFSTAAAYAIKRGAGSLVVGVCQTDYSGYPDCRASFIKQLEVAIEKAIDEKGFIIYTPLMHLTKGETVKMLQQLQGLHLLLYSHTCYNNQRPPCGECAACILRAKGFAEAGVKDPLLEVDDVSNR